MISTWVHISHATIQPSQRPRKERVSQRAGLELEGIEPVFRWCSGEPHCELRLPGGENVHGERSTPKDRIVGSSFLVDADQQSYRLQRDGHDGAHGQTQGSTVLRPGSHDCHTCGDVPHHVSEFILFDHTAPGEPRWLCLAPSLSLASHRFHQVLQGHPVVQGAPA